jgi:hypothetical protein
MATAKQKQIAKTNRDNAVKAMKNAKTPAAKAKQKAKVAALSKIMKSKTTSEETTAGSTKHALAKVARDEANKVRSAAVKKMQDLKPKSKAWQKARRNVVTASSDVRKQGNVMRDVSGRGLGQATSYTGPREAMRKYIQDVEASKGGKALTKLGDKTEFTQINQIMLSEMPGNTYAEKRDAWDRAWGEPGSDKYRAMQQKQADRHSEMINDPDYDPDFVPKIFDNLPDTTVTGPTGPTGPTVPIGDGIFGPPNPTVPSFGYPAYQDWTRFMPTNFQLAEGAGMHYQPWATGLPAVSAGMGNVAGPDRWIVGPPYTSGDTTTTGPGVINPNIWGTGATTTTPTTGVIPGSDKANDLAAGRTHHPEMYDHNDMWIGAEGGGEREAMNLDKFDAPQSAAGAAFMNALANNPVTRSQNAINAQLGANKVGTAGYPAVVPQTMPAVAPFGTVGLPSTYGDLSLMGANKAVRDANNKAAAIAMLSNVTGPVTGTTAWDSYHGQNLWDNPMWEGPLTQVNTISSGDAEIEAQIEAAIESQANGGRGWGGVDEAGREN